MLWWEWVCVVIGAWLIGFIMGSEDAKKRMSKNAN